MKALFPISLANQSFSTYNVEPAIRSVASNYSSIYVLIADDLQIYNFVARHAQMVTGFSFREAEKSATRLMSERTAWFNRLRLKVGEVGAHVSWHLLSIKSVADARAYRILRNVRILYDLDDSFRFDVDEWAESFLRTRRRAILDIGVQRRMSIQYILEEAALSMRLRVVNKIYDEFYMGSTTKPIQKIYAGEYLASAFDLALVGDGLDRFRFFEYDRDGNVRGEWKSVS
jgi:tRNA-dependent cyclodipeptide synthase